MISILRDEVSTIRLTLDKTVKYLTEMIEEAKKDDNFELLSSISGNVENLAARFISENGDTSRFHNEKQLVAYAGLDLKVYEAGSFKGKCSIKKGSKKTKDTSIFRYQL